jgi:branched-chain amino acid transport system permease protein
MYASSLGAVLPATFALDFSILFIVMIVIGGVGSVYGSVLGAIAVAVLRDAITSAEGILKHLPGIQLDPAKNGVTLEVLSSLIYGVLLIVFLMFVPTGLAGLWARVRRYFAAWPFKG